MSEQDKTIISATELIESLRETAPSAETDKSRHATTIADLTAIITDSRGFTEIGYVPEFRVIFKSFR